MQTFNVTEADNNKTISVGKGDEVIVSLPTKPGTGYSWQQAGTTVGPLVRVWHDAPSTTPGGHSMVKFVFRVDTPGQIVLDFARPWDDETPPDRWFILSVQAH